jgi:hypothetical protein
MDIEKTPSYYFQLNDFMEHKKYILSSGTIIYNYLLENRMDELAFQFIQRLAVHDNSKLEYEEFKCLCSIPLEKKSFTNANDKVDDNLKKSIELHWKHNRHHPEYFDNVEDMTELDMMEMCCDWHARSCQYGTDFLEFVKTRQENRFHFPDKMFQTIWKYCLILDEGYQKTK